MGGFFASVFWLPEPVKQENSRKCGFPFCNRSSHAADGSLSSVVSLWGSRPSGNGDVVRVRVKHKLGDAFTLCQPKIICQCPTIW